MLQVVVLSEPTIVITGAGASVPYGYPSGASLRKKIVDGILGRHPGGLIDQLGHHGHKPDFAMEFATSFYHSQQGSIDAFLEHRPEFEEIGKQAVAEVLLPCETTSPFGDGPGRWLYPLINEIFRLHSVKRAHERSKPLVFITWNYDRLLEHYFFTTFKNALNLTDEQTVRTLNNLHIIHLHGRVGPLPHERKLFPRKTVRGYGEEVFPEHVEQAANQISIVHDDIGEEEPFDIARRLLQTINRVFIMGTSFHPLNFRRLVTEEWRGLPGTPNRPPRVSFYGMSEREQRDAEGLFLAKRPLPATNCDCLKFVRDHDIVV